jgi:diguanylate cyclase (GGDEF)-like protein/PAS domain S-box-containing protein
VRHAHNLTLQEYMRIFVGVIVLSAVLEIIGYKGLGHWLYGYLWDTDKRNDWVVHVTWLYAVNAPVMFLWVVRQLKTERMYSSKLNDSQIEFQSLFYHNSEGIVSFDTEGNITNANPAIEQMMGYSVEEIKVLHRLDFLPVDMQGAAQTHFQKALAGEPQEFENTLIHKDGYAIHVQSRNIPIYRKGTVVGVYAILKNITEHKRYEHEIWTMAHYDQLTGLANRHQFRVAAEVALAQATEQPCGLGVLFIDLDRFKNINDNLGHDIGDQVLISVAKRMSSCVRSENVLAWMGGDEFAVLVPQMKNIDEAKAIADRIQEVIRRPLVVDQYEFYLTSSIGISVYPQSGESVKDLLKSADTAMYDSKRLGKNTTCVHTSSASEDSYWRLKLESDLRKVLDEHSAELYVKYQPQMSINTGIIFGAEALARWQHPTLGTIEPGEFIPLAENTGLIANLGEHLTRVVCQQIGTWKKQYPGFSLPIAINVSALQLQESNFVFRLVALLREYSVPTSSIRI